MHFPWSIFLLLIFLSRRRKNFTFFLTHEFSKFTDSTNAALLFLDIKVIMLFWNAFLDLAKYVISVEIHCHWNGIHWEMSAHIVMNFLLLFFLLP